MGSLKRRAWLVIWAALTLGAVAGAWADEDLYPGRGLSIGGRGAWYQTDTGSDGGASAHSWYGGAQARLHLTNIWALEGSVDYRQRSVAGTRIDIFPVQASVLAYILPNTYHICPFLLAGAGWYFTHLKGPGTVSDTDNRFGPHVGAGLEFYLNHKWSVDATYRHIWLSTINEPSTTANQHLTDSGHQVTAGLNYHF
jgi:opacity protein-like surface antigen